MNADQKQRAAELLAAWRATAYALHADRMADLLQELVDAPEAEPVAEVAEVSGSIAPTIVWFGEKQYPVGTKFYTAPPAPSVPDVLQAMQPSKAQLTQILNELDKYFVGESKREFLRVWIRDWTAHKLALAGQKEPSADVARDAERLDWLQQQMQRATIRTGATMKLVNAWSIAADGTDLRAAIDAARERQGG